MVDRNWTISSSTDDLHFSLGLLISMTALPWRTSMHCRANITSWSLESFCPSVHLSLHTIWIREVVIRVSEIVVYCSFVDLLTQILETSNVWHNGVNLYTREWSEEPWRSLFFQHQGEIQSGQGCLLSACLQRDTLWKLVVVCDREMPCFLERDSHPLCWRYVDGTIFRP